MIYRRVYHDVPVTYIVTQKTENWTENISEKQPVLKDENGAKKCGNS